MEILNITHEFTTLGMFTSIISYFTILVMLVSLSNNGFKNYSAAIKIIVIIFCVCASIYAFQTRVPQYEVFLTDTTYDELIEQYDVVDTRGRIIIVQDK